MFENGKYFSEATVHPISQFQLNFLGKSFIFFWFNLRKWKKEMAAGSSFFLPIEKQRSHPHFRFAFYDFPLPAGMFSGCLLIIIIISVCVCVCCLSVSMCYQVTVSLTAFVSPSNWYEIKIKRWGYSIQSIFNNLIELLLNSFMNDLRWLNFNSFNNWIELNQNE